MRVRVTTADSGRGHHLYVLVCVRLHAELTKEMKALRDECNRMLTQAVNAMHTTMICCAMTRRMDQRDKMLARAERARAGAGEVIEIE